MRQEHREIERRLASPSASDLEVIASVLADHNFKEERVIYPACSGSAFEGKAKEVATALKRARP
jgi:hemerythrin superfamily protein